MIATWIAAVLAALVVICATGWLWTWLQWQSERRQWLETLDYNDVDSVSLKEERP